MFGWFKPIKSVEDLVDKKKTLNSITWWIECNIAYENRLPGSLWPTAAQVLTDQRASCNGFAVLTYEALLLVPGCVPHIVAMMWPKEDNYDGKAHHAACFVEVGSIWYYVSNGILDVCRKATSLKEAILHVQPTVLFAAEVNREGKNPVTILSKIS